MDVLKIVRRALRKVKLSMAYVVDVYCRDAKPSEEMIDRLVAFENEISRSGLDIDDVVEAICRDYSPHTETSSEVKIRVVYGGDVREISIRASRSGVEVVDDGGVGICREPEDVIVGSVTVYFKCGREWVRLQHVHDLESVEKIRSVLRR